MTVNTAASIVLGLLTAASFAALFGLRAYHDHRGSRLLFMDLLLLIAAVEVVADDLRLNDLALVCRGALLAGGIALLASWPWRYLR